jgi:L-lactate permease
MYSRLVKISLATLISAVIGLTPLAVIAADPAPATQTEKSTAKKAEKKTKKDKKSEKKSKKKSKQKAKSSSAVNL